jgi:hypothetical protein
MPSSFLLNYAVFLDFKPFSDLSKASNTPVIFLVAEYIGQAKIELENVT